MTLRQDRGGLQLHCQSATVESLWILPQRSFEVVARRHSRGAVASRWEPLPRLFWLATGLRTSVRRPFLFHYSLATSGAWASRQKTGAHALLFPSI